MRLGLTMVGQWYLTHQFATESGRARIVLMPFHDEPTTLATLFENPPRIPRLIIPMIIYIKKLIKIENSVKIIVDITIKGKTYS